MAANLSIEIPTEPPRRADWPKLMTVQRAARELSVSRMTIYELMKCGALKSVKIGASRRIASASVEKVVNRGATHKPETV